jgi:hypothetical protein
MLTLLLALGLFQRCMGKGLTGVQMGWWRVAGMLSRRSIMVMEVEARRGARPGEEGRGVTGRPRAVPAGAMGQCV